MLLLTINVRLGVKTFAANLRIFGPILSNQVIVHMLFQKVIYGNIINKVINGNIVNMMLKIIEHLIYNN